MSDDPARSRYRHFTTIPTRWLDNDAYGHVNNVVYYAWFDTAVNRHLIEAGGLDPGRSTAIGLVVETACQFRHPLSFPEVVEAGLAVTHLGNSSVNYAIALFRAGRDDPAAFGRFVHVWVDRATRRPTPIPEPIRRALVALAIQSDQR